jgi:CHASE3 domain sensor protein
VRGYLLAGTPNFLQPYQAALRRYPGLATSLRAATTGDAQAHRLAVAISAAVSGYVSHWAAPVIHAAQTNLGGHRQPLAPAPALASRPGPDAVAPP